MKFIEGIICILVYSFLMLLAQALMVKDGAEVELPSTDIQYLADAIIMAGVLASEKD